MFNFFLNLPSFLIRKIKARKLSYSLSGVDLLIDYIFKNKKYGFYIDIGCNHPVYSNNTYLLYKRGWKGINIDLDAKSIELFNNFRKNDVNINAALSSSVKDIDLYFYHDKSPINTINKANTLIHIDKPKIKKIKTQSLNDILINSNFSNVEIDFISIDVEGHELEVLKGINFDKYIPKIISIEYLDTSLKRIELKNFKLENVLNSKIYKFLLEKNYRLVNWLHSDLIFAHKNFID